MGSEMFVFRKIWRGLFCFFCYLRLETRPFSLLLTICTMRVMLTNGLNFQKLEKTSEKFVSFDNEGKYFQSRLKMNDFPWFITGPLSMVFCCLWLSFHEKSLASMELSQHEHHSL